MKHSRKKSGGVAWKNHPPKNRPSPGGDILTDGDRETFTPRQFIHDAICKNSPLGNLFTMPSVKKSPPIV